MPDREKVISKLEKEVQRTYSIKTTVFQNGEKVSEEINTHREPCVRIPIEMADKILAILKEQEVRELTMDEWQEWKNNPKRNPICKLWEHDTSPIWVLNPNDVHEPALLMGKLKLFTGKPTFEQCKAVNWE